MCLDIYTTDSKPRASDPEEIVQSEKLQLHVQYKYIIMSVSKRCHTEARRPYPRPAKNETAYSQ